MLKRKIETYLAEWKKSETRKPLVIKGMRQCGKTYIVRKFANENYENVVYVNFILEPDKKSAFTGNIDVDTIILNLSAMIKGSRFIEGKTCIILDEIQECREARTALKSFQIDGRFDIIATGSLLGVKGYGKSRKKKDESEGQDSVPVGYETVIDMYPLDFEEFLWANGISDAVIDVVRSCFESEKAVPDGIHKVMMDLLYRYIIVGGLPEVVNCFLETRNIEQIYKLQRSLIAEYEEDMVKYADEADKPHIRECFESIPKQLAKENKKFQYSVVRKGGRASQYAGSIQWLEDAGIVRRCYNTRITELPLDGNAVEDCFKVYVTDIGVLVAMLDYGTQADILKGNLLGYKGAVFENLMADFLCKSGQKLYYFHKDSGLELDFLVRLNGECVVLEVKARTGKSKSMVTVLRNKNVYHVNSAIKLGQYNVGRDGEVLTIPLYMGFLVKDKLADVIIPDIDLSLLV
ncbi:MAG TPA: ATP-binding protein [Candidatus Coprenecus stercoravium]|uniref:ATP-binding protein n=1 Tax=Candidatus Coprenecus stercoravium TaxID=2840735 RepID=A0A9D2K9H4_9BACT|nr:ATP-binding protein [Candidatus Coprenecus stercoravium]